MSYVFLDESGNFTNSGGRQYFVVGSFCIEDARHTRRRLRAFFHSKFPRKLRRLNEIKFSDVGITDALRLKTIEFIAGLNIQIHYSFLNPHNIPALYFRKKKMQSGLRYTHIIGETLEGYLPLGASGVYVRCDRRHLVQTTQGQFRESIHAHLIPHLPAGTYVDVSMIDSIVEPNIQIADWITGAIAKYLNHAALGERYLALIKPRLITPNGMELFKKK